MESTPDYDGQQQETQEGGIEGTVTFKIVADGFGADLTLPVSKAPQIMAIAQSLKRAGIEPANSPYLWEGQPNDRGRGQARPQAPQAAPQAANPQGFDPPSQAEPQTQTMTVNGPLRWTNNGLPICPHHNTPMAESKYGGWYCRQKATDPSHANNKGYCNFSVKD